ncbi:DUF1961 family protein [Flavobacteriaceae bacterium]|nr:DUF1961 family protein [Flavobacteriaceae bacterium]
MSIRICLTLAYIFLACFNSIYADVKLPAIVSSHMVLQRNTTVVLWGWADANEQITIKTSWLKKPFKIKAKATGDWRIEVNTTNSKAPQTIAIKSKTSYILLEDILFGEVWLCSGQSNMYQPIKGYGNNQPTMDAMMAKAKAGNSNVRLFTTARKNSLTPLNDLKDYDAWQESSAENVAEFSAVAWFFGQQLQEVLDVPVGIIHSSWGGTLIQSWMSKEVLSNYQEVNLENIVLKEETKRHPTILFNAMINPLIPFTIKGVLWYQGEANRNEPEMYKKFLPAMVKDWRSRWGIGDFPFYFVQIAPYWYKNYDAFASVDNTAFMRVAMEECVELIPNSGIAITTDIGDALRIHPPNKKEVANRLLYNALQQTYGIENIDGKSPVYKTMEVQNEAIQLSFKNAETGLFAFNGLNDFEIAGNDRVFYPGSATIKEDSMVVVKNKEVSNPVAVRYAWRNWVKGTLFDKNLLPASSFRTDNWDDARRYTDGTSEAAFDAINNNELWNIQFSDNCTDDWKQNWTLDGLMAKVENTDEGMHFSAGPEFKNDAHHAVMWTNQSFAGNVKIEYDYTRTDSETNCVNILYIQATGKEEAPYTEDILAWKELREVPAMRMYYENMNALHISYAAFPNTSDTASYVRARRYPKPVQGAFDETRISPSYDNEGYFKTGETYHITVIKTGTQLFFKIKEKEVSKLFSWDLSEVDPIREGRIGLRHMYTRSATYKNFKIFTTNE